MSARQAWVCIALAACLMVGCAGTGTNNRVVFDSVRYPVSMSGYVPGPDGRLLGPQGLEPLGTVELRRRAWSTLWGFLPLHAVDFSPGVNARVDELGGEAVVNAALTLEESALNASLFLHWIPLWPGTAVVEMRGTVVRRRGVEEAWRR